ncbi:MAG: hypothetical protein ACI8PZ_005622 [Myxococcota bacterium]|jgi:hypothetical protein
MLDWLSQTLDALRRRVEELAAAVDEALQPDPLPVPVPVRTPGGNHRGPVRR